MTSTGSFSRWADDTDVPFKYVYYWHPESDALFQTTERDPDPHLIELKEHEFVIIRLARLDWEAASLIIELRDEDQP